MEAGQEREPEGSVPRDARGAPAWDEPSAHARSYHRSLIEASLDPFVTIDPDGTISDVNEATVRVTGVSRTELIGTDFSIYFTDSDKAKAGYEAAFKTGQVRDYELELRHRNGTVTPVLYNATVFRDASGQVAGVFAAARDITEQKRAERELRRTGAYNRSLIESSLDPFVTITPGGTISDVNEATVDATGISRDELVGTDFSTYFTDPERAKAGYGAAFRDGSVRDYELELRHRDGTVMPVVYNATVFRDERGEVAGVFAAARDISERKKAESEWSRLAAIVDSSDDAIIGKTLEGTIVSWNPAAQKIYGYTASEILGQHLSQLVQPDQVDEVDGILDRVRRGEPVEHYETVRIKKDGSPINVSLTLSPIRDRGGEIVGASTIARDITARKRAEEAVLRASAYNRSLIEVNLDPLVTISPDGTISDVNEATVDATGVPREELIGTDFSTYFTDPVKAKAGYETAFRTGSIRDYELELRHRDGTVMPVVYDATVFRDENEQVAGVFAAARDMTERKRAEDALLEAYNELDDRVRERTEDLVEANRNLEREIAEHKATATELQTKSQKLARSNEELQRFAYVASHDLQEPLRSIVSFSQLLERRYKGRLDSDADEYIAFVVEGGNRMQRLITDLLQFSRLERVMSEPRPTDSAEVVADALRAIEVQLTEVDAEVTIDDLPVVTVDAAQLEHVFLNLIGNAIKYRRPGTRLQVRVFARRLDDLWEFSVSDNGIGIEPEYFDRIFEIFRRLHTHEQYDGTGIGLAIVKKIVERHGGTIRVESTPGEGSTFSFTLPAP